MKTNILVALIIGIFIISSLFFSCRNVMPYSENSIFSNQYAYEGFAELEYTTNTAHQSMDSNTLNNVNNVTTECSKVFGFDGLYCKPYLADKKIDVFSEAEGKASCVGGSAGLSNSKGGLCLSESHKMLLKTRGGNATGKQFEIGK